MNTQKQKIISFLITLIIIFSTSVFAEEVSPEPVEKAATVSLRIEGISENKLYEKEAAVEYYSEILTVSDVLKSVLSEEDYVYETSEYGSYFSSLFGETENTFEYDYDGWQFRINGEKSEVGVDGCEVKEGDEILFYYGPMSIAYPHTPVVTYRNDGVLLSFTYEKTTYDEAWNAIVETVPLDNAEIIWYCTEDISEKYITDENGEILIPLSQAEAGNHKIQIDKKSYIEKDGVFVPLAVRFAPDYEIEIKEPDKKTLSLRIEGISENKFCAKEAEVEYYSEILTVTDVIKSLLSEEDYVYETSEYGSYFSSLFGETENTFEYDYDGWQFRINGEKSEVGVDSCAVEEGDEILFYYGPMSIAYPDIPTVKYTGNSFEIAFTYEKTTYDEAWNATIETVPLDNAEIIWYCTEDISEKYTTDENGKIFISEEKASAGKHKIQIDKKGDIEKDGVFVPLAVRFADDFYVDIPVLQQPAPSISSGGGGGSGYIQSLKEKNEEKEEIKEDKKEDEKEETKEASETKEETAKESSEVLFEDIKGHWAESFIKKLGGKGYINGKTEEKFEPEDFITRAEYVAILYRMSGDTDFEKSEEFDDVSENDWFFEAVCWAKQKGIVNGKTENIFSPSDNITREQLAVVSSKYISYKEIKLQATTDIKKFTDETEFSSWSYSYISSLAQLNIINGNEKGEFMPKNNTKRGEAAKILSYLIQE